MAFFVLFAFEAPAHLAAGDTVTCVILLSVALGSASTGRRSTAVDDVCATPSRQGVYAQRDRDRDICALFREKRKYEKKNVLCGGALSCAFIFALLD